MIDRGVKVYGRHRAGRRSEFLWQPGELMSLADKRCTKCMGTGQVTGWAKDRKYCCPCVYRRIFRHCAGEYRRLQVRSEETDVALWRNGGAQPGAKPGMGWHRPAQNYLADFEILARRTLRPQDYRLFRLCWVQGWLMVEAFRKVGLSRGDGFHRIYMIEDVLGQAYAETQPYGLWPISEYHALRDDLQFEGAADEWRMGEGVTHARAAA